MIYKPVVFISSTSELAMDREVLATALRKEFELYMYEEDRAAGERAPSGTAGVWSSAPTCSSASSARCMAARCLAMTGGGRSSSGSSRRRAPGDDRIAAIP